MPEEPKKQLEPEESEESEELKELEKPIIVEKESALVQHLHKGTDTPQISHKDLKDVPDHGEMDGLGDKDHSAYIAKDGTTTITQNIPFNSKKITGLLNPTADQDAATKKYHDDNISRTGLAIYGNGQDGDVVISGNTTLTEDKYYDDLTINNGITLTTAGYRVFVKGTLTLTGSGKISNVGGAGGNGGNGDTGLIGNQVFGGTGGTAGTAAAGAYLPAAVAGKAGATGGNGSGSGNSNGKPGGHGTNGENVTPRALGLAGNGGGGGAEVEGGSISGGADGGIGGNASSGGTITTTSLIQKPYAVPHAIYVFDLDSSRDFQPYQAGAGGGSGAGGGGGCGTAGGTFQFGGGGGGAGGGSGGNGGFLFICAKDIVLTGAGEFTVAGGNAGNGGDGGDGYSGDDCGGGAGGSGAAGGNGGIVIFIYSTFIDSVPQTDPTISIAILKGSGGSGGALGTSYGTASGAQPGNSGNDGVIGIRIIIQN